MNLQINKKIFIDEMKHEHRKYQMSTPNDSVAIFTHTHTYKHTMITNDVRDYINL